jgi:hypothetical protein
MTTYVLDIETHLQRNDESGYNGCPLSYKYFFKIDIIGNVNISKQSSIHTNGRGAETGEKKIVVTIDDNIPVPKYFINIIKALILQTTLEEIGRENKNAHLPREYQSKIYDSTREDKGIYKHVYEHYWIMVIDVIKRIKQEVRELIENPQDNLDIKTQLDTYMSKTNQQQENILALEKKIENIQTAYFDALNDNKKIKEMNSALRTRISELESKLNEEVTKTNSKKQLDEYYKLEQKRLEELEKERVWYEYNQRKNNFNPLNH